LTDVSFRYEKNSSKEIISNFNLEISKGDIIAIVGKSGSGKSTLIDIILGLLEPTSGRMLINHVKHELHELDFWKENISIVPQVIYLSNDTVLNNITLNSDSVDWPLLDKCLSAADLKDTIAEDSSFLHKIVGENGNYLSGGQRQKVSIARALYLNRDVLILDEATSNLDNESESKIIRQIFEVFCGITIIIVTEKI
jgi:ABC-type bacteriocin/lantibiotic exporter with double-glycine peptidase domain